LIEHPNQTINFRAPISAMNACFKKQVNLAYDVILVHIKANADKTTMLNYFTFQFF